MTKEKEASKGKGKQKQRKFRKIYLQKLSMNNLKFKAKTIGFS